MMIDPRMTPTNDATVTVEPDWPNADVCIENMQIAYDDATEDEDETPVDTVVSAGDLGVLIGLAEYAVRHRLAALASAPAGEGEHAACPFCRSEAHTVKSPDGPTWRVGCTSRDCVARPWLTGETIADAWAMWDAALARPRAAVGEREAHDPVQRLVEAARPFARISTLIPKHDDAEWVEQDDGAAFQAGDFRRLQAAIFALSESVHHG